MAKILVIDDEPDLLKLLATVLSDDGHDVVGELDGIKAFGRFQREKPDLVILDLMMPKIDGLDICQQIRSDSKLPIIILSATSSEEKIIEGYERGADDYILKPFEPSELKAKVKVHLRRAKLGNYDSPDDLPSRKDSKDDSDVTRMLFGKYALLEQIGSGGSGRVYRAHLINEPENTIALKILSPVLSGDRAFLQRFLQEAEFARAVDEPRIAKIYEAGHFHGAYYYTMELVEGISLTKAINLEGPLDIPNALHMVSDILNALAAIHEADLIHQDVSGNNILLSLDGMSKLVDFGIARQHQKAGQSTTHRFLMGTPQFMSPEIALGEEQDIRSDLYSLGIALYFALVGNPPFTGKSMNILYQHIHDEFTVPGSIPGPVAQFIHTLTAKSPESRPTHPGEALIQLSNIIE